MLSRFFPFFRKEMAVHLGRYLKKNQTNIWCAVLAWKGGALCKHSKGRRAAQCEWTPAGGRTTKEGKSWLCKHEERGMVLHKRQTHGWYNSVYRKHRTIRPSRDTGLYGEWDQQNLPTQSPAPFLTVAKYLFINLTTYLKNIFSLFKA